MFKNWDNGSEVVIIGTIPGYDVQVRDAVRYIFREMTTVEKMANNMRIAPFSAADAVCFDDSIVTGGWCDFF